MLHLCQVTAKQLLAVPHRGSDILSSSLATNFRSKNRRHALSYNVDLPHGVRHQLTPGQVYLQTLDEDFFKITAIRDGGIQFWCFHETIAVYGDHLDPSGEIVVPQDSAQTFAGRLQQTVALLSDHWGTSRFESRTTLDGPDASAPRAQSVISREVTTFAKEFQSAAAQALWPDGDILSSLKVENTFYSEEGGRMRKRMKSLSINDLLQDFSAKLHGKMFKQEYSKKRKLGKRFSDQDKDEMANTDLLEEMACAWDVTPKGVLKASESITETSKRRPSTTSHDNLDVNGTVSHINTGKPHVEASHKSVRSHTSTVERKATLKPIIKRVHWAEKLVWQDSARPTIFATDDVATYRFRWVHTPCNHTAWAEVSAC